MVSVHPFLALIAPLPWGFYVAKQCCKISQSIVWLLLLYIFNVAAVLSFYLAYGNVVTVGFAFATGVLVSHLLGLSIIDAQTAHVPDLLTIPFIATGLAHAWLTVDSFAEHALTVCVTGSGIIFIKKTVEQLFHQTNSLGSGDVLMIMGVAAWLGPFGTADAIILSVCLAALHMAIRRNSGIPYAPVLCGAAWWVWLFGPILSA